MPELDKESILDKSRRYSNIKYALAFFNTLYLVALILLFLGLGISNSLVQIMSISVKPQYLVFPAYLLALFILYYTLSFPLNLYRSFILEHKFCLTHQKFSNWLIDQVKAGLLSYIIGLIIFAAFYYILKNNPGSWWVIISLFWIFFSFILAKLLPIVIIPLFFKYKPLSDENLRSRILNLAEKMKVKILNVFEIDFSKKTLKANAAFVGWGKTRRVILADTLKDKYSYDEIEVILAHEFSHYKLKHLFKLIFINSLTTILAFYLIFRTNILVMKFFGLTSLEDLAAFPLIVLYLVIFGIIMQPLENYFSRRFERDADIMALEITGLRESFISMMNKLANQNLSDRRPHPIIKLFFFDHPPVDERISMAKSL